MGQAVVAKAAEKRRMLAVLTAAAGVLDAIAAGLDISVY
jgi:hypothetical protein